MMSEEKVNKEAFLESVAEESAIPYNIVQKVYLAMLSKGEEIVFSGKKLSLKGFGIFSKQYHKGHPVQFGRQGEFVESYPVFKFSASHLLNQRIREYDGQMDLYLEEKKRNKEESTNVAKSAKKSKNG